MHAMQDTTPITRAAELLRRASRVFVITGAGISADSGLPTYRGIGGLYDTDGTEDGMPIEQALSGDMLSQRPDICWKYIAQIEAACRGATFNAAHQVLAELAPRYARLCVLTQNVDGFHRDAGSRDVIEMHGNIRRLSCTGCNHSEAVSDFAHIHSLPPYCECGAILRPDVVLFGEQLPGEALSHYYEALESGIDLVISIGTTAVFPYIAAPVDMAARQGVPTIEINPDISEISHLVDLHIRDRAAATLTAIQASLLGQQ